MTKEAQDPRFDVIPAAVSHFSWLRTRMSADRTLMSWIRRVVALIGFGFTIVQFFDHVAQMPGAHPAAAPHAPRYFGLLLIVTGVFAVVVSVWQSERWSLIYGRASALSLGSIEHPDARPCFPPPSPRYS